MDNLSSESTTPNVTPPSSAGTPSLAAPQWKTAASNSASAKAGHILKILLDMPIAPAPAQTARRPSHVVDFRDHNDDTFEPPICPGARTHDSATSCRPEHIRRLDNNVEIRPHMEQKPFGENCPKLAGPFVDRLMARPYCIGRNCCRDVARRDHNGR